MRHRRRILVVCALALSGAAALAQPAPAPAPQPPAAAPQAPDRERDRARIVEDAVAFAEGRIAGLKATLRLGAEQERLWPPFESAMRDAARGRAERAAARRAAMAESRDGDASRPRPDILARMRAVSADHAARAAELTKLAEAAEPLLASFGEDQRRRFNALVRLDEDSRFRRWPETRDGRRDDRFHDGWRGGWGPHWRFREGDRRDWRDRGEGRGDGWRDGRAWRDRPEGRRDDWRPREEDRRGWRGRDEDDDRWRDRRRGPGSDDRRFRDRDDDRRGWCGRDDDRD